ncbi:ABC transporter substrate-binding protein [Spiractinospora alimapuensis]|uniref:ABC transporter substrate-binding protein n=1 Tax=Spiractinospora alimapuensis TaxID=2820884 RepID=UPI001F2C3DDC|nr:ABC transporter substrate-binding protein [Spiractinospora alimapuensis]QVQ51213.1 ABC transporter substrate-binding protein [Spiractinospora alimapuensis]
MFSVAMVGSLALTGCGVGQGSAIEIGEEDSIRIGVVPTASFAPLYIAMEEGYFEERGIDVELDIMQNAAAVAPSVLNGQLQIGTAATSPFFAAVEKGIPVRALASSSLNSVEEDDETALVIPTGSDVERPADLEGRTVAVNALAALPHVAAGQVIRDDGGDPDAVTFVSMAFPDMVSALSSGRVDAAAMTEPFLSQGEGTEHERLTGLYSQAFSPETTTTLYFTAQPFIDVNPELVDDFTLAIHQAGEHAREDPELVAEVLVTHGGMDPQDAAGMRLPSYGSELSTDSLRSVADVMAANGFLEQQIDIATVIHDD